MHILTGDDAVKDMAGCRVFSSRPCSQHAHTRGPSRACMVSDDERRWHLSRRGVCPAAASADERDDVAVVGERPRGQLVLASPARAVRRRLPSSLGAIVF
jgi:hypothetical protein